MAGAVFLSPIFSYLKVTTGVYADGRLRTAAGRTVIVEQDSAGRPVDSKQRDEKREEKRRVASHICGASQCSVITH